MKNLLFILLISTLSATLAFGQTESVQDSIPPQEKKELKESNNKLNHYLDIDIKENETKDIFKHQVGDSLREKSVLQNTELTLHDFTFNLPPIDVRREPPLEPSPIIHNPFINDYTFSSGQILANNLWISTNSTLKTLPSIGANRIINVNFNYQPTNWLIISGGVYGAKYNHIYGGSFLRKDFNDIGANSRLKFILHDRISLNAFGQYSVYGEKNRVGGPMMHMYPHTYYGGSIEVKVTDKFGVEGGVVRELNPFNGKWENRLFIAPVFYGN